MSQLNSEPLISLPPQPETLIEFTRRIQVDEPDIAALVEALKKDPALYSAVLATANSHHFGRGTTTTSLTRAIMRLGLKKLQTIVRLIALKDTLNNLGRIDRFWDTAVEVADITARLVSLRTTENTDDAYSLGMLHDCGIPIMMQAYPDYKQFLTSSSWFSSDKQNQLENERYQCDHFILGGLLASKWALPPNVCEAISAQSNIEECLAEESDASDSVKTLLCYLLLAKDISQSYRAFWRANDSRDTPHFLPLALSYLGISGADYTELKDMMLDKIAEAEDG